jgi:hypothetical protein
MEQGTSLYFFLMALVCDKMNIYKMVVKNVVNCTRCEPEDRIKRELYLLLHQAASKAKDAGTTVEACNVLLGIYESKGKMALYWKLMSTQQESLKAVGKYLLIEQMWVNCLEK